MNEALEEEQRERVLGWLIERFDGNACRRQPIEREQRHMAGERHGGQRGSNRRRSNVAGQNELAAIKAVRQQPAEQTKTDNGKMRASPSKPNPSAPASTDTRCPKNARV